MNLLDFGGERFERALASESKLEKNVRNIFYVVW